MLLYVVLKVFCYLLIAIYIYYTYKKISDVDDSSQSNGEEKKNNQ